MTLYSKTPHVVYTSPIFVTLPGDVGWTEQPYLVCDEHVRGMSPTISAATLRWEFGTASRVSDDGPEPTMAYRARISLTGQYVKISYPTLNKEWFGYVAQDGLDRWPQEDDGGGTQRLTGGTESYTAYGFEWFLGGEPIESSFIADGTRIERAIGFNQGFGNGRGLEYGEGGNKAVGSLAFAATPTSSEKWDAYRIVCYLLSNHGPKNSTGANSPVTFKLLDSAIAFLVWFKPSVDTAGHSVLEVLNDVININRGICWKLDVIPNPDDPFTLIAAISVTSMATAAVSLPGGATLPAALVQTTLVTEDFHERPQIRRDMGREYDRIYVRGSRRRAVFTVSYSSGNLTGHYFLPQEDDYRIAVGTDPKENDRYRQSNKLEAVYQQFRIPSDWDGKSNDGSAPPADYACPKVAQGSTSPLGPAPMATPGLRLLRAMPIKIGLQYDNATAPTGTPPADAEDEWQRPFGVVDVGDGKWRFLHEINTTAEADGSKKLVSYGFRVLDSVAGFQLNPSGGMPHCLAKTSFHPGVGTHGATEHEPEIDVRLARFTVAGEWDEYCQGYYPVADPTVTDRPVRNLYIEIGERARLDWLAAGTIYDLEGDTLKTVSTGGPVRDDRNLCAQIAQLAFQWYGVSRAEVTLHTSETVLPVDVGDLITAVGTGAASETVNAMASQITLLPEQGGMSLTAGYAELKFEGLI